MAETRRVKLGDVADFLTGFPFKSADYTDDASGVRLLRGDNIVQGALRWEGVKRWPASLVDQHELYLLTSGDVVVAMDRPWIEAGLKYAALADEDCPSLLVQRVTRLRETNHIKARYLRYVIGSRAFTEHVLAVQTGTAVPHISGGQIKAFEFLLPPLPTQEAVTSVLGALDDKIELNRRMNETLEAMARAIFKDWFIDFGPTRAKMEGRAPYLAPDIWSLFPDRLDDDGKPERWRTGKLGDVAKQVGQTVSPETLDPDTPYIGLEHMPRRSIALSEWEGAGKVTSGKLAFQKGDFLFGKLRPYFHKVGIAPLDGICSTDIVVLNARERSAAAFVLACISQDEFVAFTDRTSDGTKMPRTSWSRMERYGLCLPDAAALEAFSAFANPMLGRIVANIHESRTLAATRDLLLPKLMSGEIRVRDAEKAVEATQ
jgi:type I restriction enzyme S subunit